MNKSRTKNALLNIIFGYLAQIGIFILSFVGRRVFLHFLSADYLGVNGLYSNILTVLSLAELGLDSAVIFSLYKPVAEGNNKLVLSLLKFFKRVYYVLAALIIVLGLCVIPFLKYLINSDLPLTDLTVFYLLFLANTVASYFVAHKVALLSACQEQRIQKIITLTITFFLQITYIVVLFLSKNFYFYTIATLISTVITNLTLSFVCSRIHPEIFKEKQSVEFDKKPIIKRIGSTFLYKLGAVIITSTDNILISVLVSTLAVGLYSNYLIVISAVQAFVAIISTSLIAGIGNLAAKQCSSFEQSNLFDMTLLFYHGLGAVGLVGFSLLFNNFISIWLGSNYVFDSLTVFIIAINFYLNNAIAPVWMFREANGKFDEVKYLLLVRATLNIAFSILFGLFWGVFGIFVATTLSLLLTNFWFEPRILSKAILNRDRYVYWKKQLKYFLVTYFSFVMAYTITSRLDDSFGMFAVKVAIVCTITGLAFFVANYKTREFKSLFGYVFKHKKQ